MKPIFYYLENPTTLKICGQYGAFLERLTVAQKLELIGYLGLWLSDLVGSDKEESHWSELPIDATPESEVEEILGLCDGLEPAQVVNFMAGVVEVTAV